MKQNHIYHSIPRWGIIASVVVALGLTSCMDTTVLPADKTIEEDFWKTKSDVQLMVTGSYTQLLNANTLTRMLLWGELRSDELNLNTTPTGTIPTALEEINSADIQNTNTFCDWSSIYSVINNCNVVLSHAEQVMSIDPSYTQGDYLVDRSQMLALRALCYFYLVRAYRDVPYSDVAFMNSSQDLQIPQQAPATVLEHCITDLREAAQNAISPDGYSDWRKVGYINRDGIYSLLADIYLWRASINHDATDYQACVDACQQVIQSKQALYPKDALDETASDYPLETGESAFTKIFVNGNSKESIFELQYDGSSNSNTSVCQYYYMYSKSTTHGYTYAAPIFSGVGSSKVYQKVYDYRYWNNTYDVGNEQMENFDVRKMVTSSTSTVNPLSSPTAFKRTAEGRAYANFAQNWIVYRLSDVMLMEAEARVQLAARDNDIQLRQAFNLVKEVNTRSLAQASDSIKYASYASVSNMEQLVLQERQRELCFEGKRWFDLMRYNYRHITGSDLTKTLYELNAAGQEFPRNYSDMLSLVAVKYGSSGSGVTAKMRTEPLLYLPILQSELKVNSSLKQNPAYNSDDEYEKNY